MGFRNIQEKLENDKSYQLKPNDFFSIHYIWQKMLYVVQTSLLVYLIIKTVARTMNTDIKFNGLFRGPLLQN